MSASKNRPAARDQPNFRRAGKPCNEGLATRRARAYIPASFPIRPCMKRLLSATAVSLALLAPLVAQSQRPGAAGTPAPATRAKTPFPLWKAELPGGSYLVARNAISAVSSQQYVLDGVARVTEVNVTTNGNFHPRFYFFERLDVNAPANVPGAQVAQDAVANLAKEAVDQANPEIVSKVVKNYPATTHAGTIEFRLPSADAVQKLYESVTRVWLTGESEVFTLNGTRPLNTDEEIKDANDPATGRGGPGSTGSGTN
jgi:hypothetical protein